MPKLADIPQLTDTGSYRINVSWKYLKEQIGNWEVYERQPLNLNPDFQRGHVWSPEQRTAYVEYVLSGGRSGREIYFNCPGWQRATKNANEYNDFVIVDGKQRLHAVLSFLDNKLPIFGGNLFRDYTDSLRMTGADFVFCVNDLDTKEKVLKWYLEMNSGGTPHTKEELDKVRKMLDK